MLIMDWKSFSYGVLTIFIILFVVVSFGLAHVGKVNAINGNTISIGSQTGTDLSNIPEKCRVPAGQDIDSWKEHLGHHSETKDCLKYFN